MKDIEAPKLRISVYPSKAQNTKLKDVSIELLKENIPQSTSINQSIVSPDKQKFIMACSDESIYVWNRKEKTLEKKLVGHSEHVTVLAHHPKKNILVSGASSMDSTLKIWDLKNYELLKTIGKQGDESTIVDDPNNKGYYLLEFIDNGSYLLAIYSNNEDEHTLEIFESKNFTLVQTTALKSEVHLFTASLNGELLAFYNDRYESTIQILSFKNRTIKAYKEFFVSVDDSSKLFFSEDNKYLCEYDTNNNCRNLSQTDTLCRNLIFFNNGEKELKRLFIDDLEETQGMFFIANEQYICVTQKNALRIFEVENQREIIDNDYRELLDKKLMFNIAKIKQIVDESTAIVKEEEEYLFFSKALYSQAFSPKGNILAIGTEKGIEFWNIEAKKFVMSWEISDGTYLKHADEISYIDENHLLVTLNADLFIITIDKQEIKHCFPQVDAFTLHQEKQLLAFSQSEENKLVLFSLVKNKVLEVLHLNDTLDSLAFNHDATLLAGSQINHYLTVWESKTFKKVYRESSEQTAYCDNFSKLLFTNDGEKLIAINSWRNEIELRQVNAFFSWRKWAIFKEFDAIDIAINPKTKEFAIACNEKEHLAFLNHKLKKQKNLPLDPSELHSNSLLYSPDGKYLSVIDSKGFVKLFSQKKRELESILVAGREGEWLIVENNEIYSSSSLDFLAKKVKKKLIR